MARDPVTAVAVSFIIRHEIDDEELEALPVDLAVALGEIGINVENINMEHEEISFEQG